MSRRSLTSRIPAPLRPPLRRLKRAIAGFLPGAYDRRVEAERRIYSSTASVHDLPPIAHYWSRTHVVPILQPFGFNNATEMFRLYTARVCRERPQETCRVLSIGAGDCAFELGIARWLRDNGLSNFVVECLDLNAEVLERGRTAAAAAGLAERFQFTACDINAWRPERRYEIVMAFQCLHHFVHLERLFETIHLALDRNGFFLIDDMIGRNGHMRWPEALAHVNALWKELPREYTYNHALKRHEPQYENPDSSVDGFEGIRAQDILPLLVQTFHFDLFIGFGNVVDAFVDRSFGPNFDPAREWDRAFIDRLHALDMAEMESGRLKPTHMIAALTRTPPAAPKFHRNLSPQFSVRPPDGLAARIGRRLGLSHARH